MKHIWRLNHHANEAASNHLQKELGVSQIVSNLLVNRGVEDFDEAKKFFRPSLSDLYDPFLLKDMDRASGRLITAINLKQKVMVYGDYDVDGTTSVAMMAHFLTRHTQCVVNYYIPDRYTEGYGISKKFIDGLKESKTDLVITLDCGIRAVDLIQEGNGYGADFIICDHHEPGTELPPAYAVLDPKRPDCNYPFSGLSGCGVGFKLIQAVVEKLELDASLALQYLDLLTISIGADIVPMVNENRILAYYGLKELNENPRAGLKTILTLAGLRKAELSIGDVVFILAPRINAAGRIKHALSAVELMLAESETEAAEVCLEIEGYNKERKSVDRAITAEALGKLTQDSFYQTSKSTVIWGKNWHKGVIGIVASRLIENHYKPTIVLTEKDGVAVGSARSIKGIDIHQALRETEDLLLKYGGHTMAAGLSIKTELLPEFRTRFEEVISKHIGSRDLKSELLIEQEIALSDIDAKFYRLLNQFAPFGPMNMTPLFMATNCKDAGYSKLVGESKDHLKLTISQNGDDTYLSGIAFKQAEHYKLVKSGSPFDVAFAISINEWNGNKTLQLDIRDIRPSEEA
ncbi:MAG: single-stranded-DNA-specific exonuclease RecJ [Flavobacteriales bacterium]